MKYIDYVNDWFALYINPMDYEGKAELFTQHIFETLPFLERLPKSAEQSALIDVITINSQILIQIIEENHASDAACAFINLQTQIIRLKDLIKKYAITHFAELCQDDPFYLKLQQYLKNTAKSLSSSEEKAIQEAYITLKMEELSLALTCDLAEKDHLGDLAIQTEIDKLSIEVEKFRFLGLVRAIILNSKESERELKKELETKLLAFCDYVDSQTMFKKKFDHRGTKQQATQFLRAHFADLQALEKMSNEIKVEELNLRALFAQEKLKHRSPKNLAIIQQQIANKKHKIATNQALYESRQITVEQALLSFYQNVLRFPINEKYVEVCDSFGLAHDLPAHDSLYERAVGLFSLVSKAVETFLPSSIDLQLGVIGVAAGALIIGAGPLGIGAGLGVGLGAIKTNHTVKHVANEAKAQWQACNEALFGKFTSTYRTSSYQVNRAISSVCDNNEVEANIINAFYVRYLMEYDFKIATHSQDEVKVAQLNQEKAQLKKHYHQLRNGQLKAKDFWSKHFKQDVGLLLLDLQSLLKHHTNAFLLCLYDQFGNQQGTQAAWHQNRLIGIMEELNHLGLLADKKNWKKLREQNAVAYRSLVKTPLDLTYEEHIERLVFHHSPLHLLFWLSEQATYPKRTLAQPLPRFEGKTFWHLLAEREDGAALLQQMITAPEVVSSSRTGAIIIQKLWKFIASFKDEGLFDLKPTYQGMNSLGYAFALKNVPLVRSYLEQVIEHPQRVHEMGLTNVFDFMIQAHPQIRLLIDSLKPQGFAAIKQAWPFNQKPNLQLSMMAGLTMYALKENSLPQTKSQWNGFFLELRQKDSAYIQIKGFFESEERVAELAQRLYTEPKAPMIAAPQPLQLEPAAPALLITYKTATNALTTKSGKVKKSRLKRLT